MGHAFANTLLFLDLERQGFNYPVVPVAVNCYGSNNIRMRGGANAHSDEPDPPSPSPRRCFEVGQATARIIRDNPRRVVLMASSSWSHAFLTEKNHWSYPDLEADRALLEHLRVGEFVKCNVKKSSWKTSKSRDNKNCSTGPVWWEPCRNWDGRLRSWNGGRPGLSMHPNAWPSSGNFKCLDAFGLAPCQRWIVRCDNGLVSPFPPSTRKGAMQEKSWFDKFATNGSYPLTLSLSKGLTQYWPPNKKVFVQSRGTLE